MRTTPDWIQSAQERLLHEPAPDAAVDAVIRVLHKLGEVVLLSLDSLHSMDEVPGPPAHKNPQTPVEHAENLLYAGHRLYSDGPGRQFVDAPDWIREVDRSIDEAREALGRPAVKRSEHVEITRETAGLILGILRTMAKTYDGEQLRQLLPQSVAAMEEALRRYDGGFAS